MSFSYEEVDDILKVASAVVINIGTMNSANFRFIYFSWKNCE